MTIKKNKDDYHNEELIAIILQEGFGLDWQDIEDQLDKEQILLQAEVHSRFMENADASLFYLGFSDQSVPLSNSVNFLRTIAAAFVKALSETPEIEFLREKTIVEPESEVVEHILSNAPYMNGLEYLSEDWVLKIWSKLNNVFSKEIRAFDGSVSDYFTSKSPGIHIVGRVFFHLVESKKDDYPFAFLATYSSGAAKDGKSKHLPLKNALVEYKEDNKKLLELLSTVNRAKEKSSLISEFMDSGEIFHPLSLTSTEAYTFLTEIPLYEDAGILCRIPNWWKRKSNSLKMSVSIGNKGPSHLGFDALLDFNAQLSIGDETITVDEFKKLLSETDGLAFIKGKWIEVDHDKLKETLRAYEQVQKFLEKTEMTVVEAMRFQLNASAELNVSEESCELEVTNGEWLNTVISSLTQPEKIEEVPTGEDFRAELRPYQHKGLAWLNFMKNLGLGACLADDMGLGKTVQIIALLNYIRTHEQEKTLLVIPASLIGNWMNEIEKFAPSLKYCVLHPSERNAATEDDKELLKEYDIFITTYGMLLRYDWIKDVSWNSLILDEAQAIKNPGTKQTRAVKQIKAGYKVAMTGTPIENRLSDLWSLFDFLNRGLLGSAKEFSNFTKQLKENHDGYFKLKKVVSPFILRRLKTDKSIIADLPEKIEMKTFSALSKKQMALYTSLLNELKAKLESSEAGIERKGLILSSLMKFKQICNHPDQYLGQNSYAESDSGKFERLREICETIYEKRERVLVFTQFKEITESLKDFLETVFHHKGLVLHGETPVAKRRDIVSKFQDQEYVPFLVLSIKAGGVGLNLTSANHVVHFDRWWNPAVENQATDRAFRIGQQKNVLVHKFITKGTIEEKIDLLIEEKTKLSKEIIPDVQENWITEMDNKQLMDLFRLSL